MFGRSLTVTSFRACVQTSTELSPAHCCCHIAGDRDDRQHLVITEGDLAGLDPAFRVFTVSGKIESWVYFLFLKVWLREFRNMQGVQGGIGTSLCHHFSDKFLYWNLSSEYQFELYFSVFVFCPG